MRNKPPPETTPIAYQELAGFNTAATMPKLNKRLVDALEADPDRDVVVWDSELRGFGVRVKPSGRKTYILQYRNAQGRSRRTTLGKHGVITCRKARQDALQDLAEVSRGDDPAEARQSQRKGITMRELAERYIKEHLAPKRKASTVHEWRRLLRTRILPRIGNRKAAALSRNDVERLHRSLARTPTTANRVVSVISAMLGFAERRDLRPQGPNPCALIERYPEKPRERFLSPEELARLGKALNEAERAKTAHPSAILAIRLLTLTGMRRSEVLNLRWKAVDFERSCLLLEDSKTGRKRVPLAPPALQLLAEADQSASNPYVCWGRRKNARLVGLQKVWERIREDAGIEDVRLHDLRHTFASFGAMEGIGLFLIGKVLGHKQASTTERYAHVGPDPVHMAASAIGERVAALLQGNEEGGAR